jgi:energy-coupling factor transporter ATP-binding protein EcfA2
MPINGFQIKGVGPIKLAQADNLPSVVIIAGPNGVGKSTLLDTLKKRGGNTSINGSGKFLYVPPYRTPVTFALHRSLPFIGPRRRYIDVLQMDTFSLSAPGVSLPHYLTSGGPRSRLAPDFAPYSEVKYKLAQIRQEFASTLTDVFTKLGEIPRGYMPSDIYKPFRVLVKRLLPGLEFGDISLEGETYKIKFLNRMGVLVEFDDLSSGEKDIIAMLFPFIEKEIENELAKARCDEIPHEDLVILIDTPEAYLHPALQRNLLEYMRDSVQEADEKGEKLQFFVATHSTTIINAATPEELYVMLFPDQVLDGNQITKITTDKEKLHTIQEIMGDIGIASLATGKPILLLEGPTDPEILTLLLPEVKEKFTLLSSHGKSEILRFSEGFSELIGELASRGFKIFAIVDRDSQMFGVKSEFCFIWPAACIENFLLLDSEAIYEALKVVAGEAKLQDSEIKSKEDVDKLINGIITDAQVHEEEIRRRMGQELRFVIGENWRNLEELKEVASQVFDKRFGRLEESYKKVSAKIAEVRGSKEKARTELNGKIILGKMAGKFSVRREVLARSIADK